MLDLTDDLLLTMILKTNNQSEMEWLHLSFKDGRLYYEETDTPHLPRVDNFYQPIFDNMNILYRMQLNDLLSYVYFAEDSYYIEAKR